MRHVFVVDTGQPLIQTPIRFIAEKNKTPAYFLDLLIVSYIFVYIYLVYALNYGT